MTDFYEDDEPLEHIREAWERGESGITLNPQMSGIWILNTNSVVIRDCYVTKERS